MSGTRHNCLGPGITGRGPDIISRGPDIFISGPRPYSQWRSLGPDIKSRRPDIISQGPNLVSWGPNMINSWPRHTYFLFILKYYFSHSTQYNHLYDVPSQPPYKRPIWVKIDDFFSCVTLQLDVWHWKTIGHLFYATSSFVHHFVAIGDFKLELQSGNAQLGSNSTIFRAVWPCNFTYDLEKQLGTSSMLL